MAASFWPAMKACAAGPGSSVATLTSFTLSPFFFSIQASVKYGAVPGAEAATVLPLRSAILAMLLRTTMPSAPYDLSSWTTCRVATPLAFQRIQVSTVVAAHCTSPEAMARWRSFCGMNLIVTSTPRFLKIPVFSASDSGAKPVHPLMATVTLGRSWAGTGTAASTTRTATTRQAIRMTSSWRWPGARRSAGVVYGPDADQGHPRRSLPDPAAGRALRQHARQHPGLRADHRARARRRRRRGGRLHVHRRHRRRRHPGAARP